MDRYNTGTGGLTDIARTWRGDFSDRDLVDGQLRLTPAETAELDIHAGRFQEEVHRSSGLRREGYPVPAGYQAQVRQWTARSRIVTVAGRRVFLLYNYPASWKLRAYFLALKLVRGIPLWKPVGRGWKRAVEAWSIVPVIAWDRPDMVAMPFIDAVNARDLFVFRSRLQGLEDAFGWTRAVSRNDLLRILADAAALLREAHRAGRTWGEVVLQNVIVDAARRPVLIDPETVYFGMTDRAQRARDLAVLIDSAHRAFVEAEGWDDRPAVADCVLGGYHAMTRS